MIESKIIDRLDLSHDFWAKFNVQNKKLKKQVGLFDVENINVANIITIAINPKEYREEFENFSNNKKHKGIKKGTQVWTSALTVQNFVILQTTLMHIIKIKNKKQKSLSKNDFKL